MSSLQERLHLKRTPIDVWSTKEQLWLASSVARNGDQNWMSVSRTLRSLGDSDRPADWFSQKNCAAQYGALLEHVETPKRKKRASDGAIESPQESILKKLTQDRMVEVEKILTDYKQEYMQIKEEIKELMSGDVSEARLREMCAAMEAERRHRERDQLRQQQWLREREERKQQTWRPVPSAPTPTVGASSPLLTSLLKSAPTSGPAPSHHSTPPTQLIHIPHPSTITDMVSPSAGAPTLSMLLEKPGGALASAHAPPPAPPPDSNRHAVIEQIKNQLQEIEQRFIGGIVPTSQPSIVSAPVLIPEERALAMNVEEKPQDKIDIDDIEIKDEDVYAFSDFDLEIPPVSTIHKSSLVTRALDKNLFSKKDSSMSLTALDDLATHGDFDNVPTIDEPMVPLETIDVEKPENEELKVEIIDIKEESCEILETSVDEIPAPELDESNDKVMELTDVQNVNVLPIPNEVVLEMNNEIPYLEEPSQLEAIKTELEVSEIITENDISSVESDNDIMTAPANDAVMITNDENEKIIQAELETLSEKETSSEIILPIEHSRINDPEPREISDSNEINEKNQSDSNEINEKLEEVIFHGHDFEALSEKTAKCTEPMTSEENIIHSTDTVLEHSLDNATNLEDTEICHSKIINDTVTEQKKNELEDNIQQENFVDNEKESTDEDAPVEKENEKQFEVAENYENERQMTPEQPQPVVEEIKAEPDKTVEDQVQEESQTETDDDTPMEVIREEEKHGKTKRDYSRRRVDVAGPDCSTTDVLLPHARDFSDDATSDNSSQETPLVKKEPPEHIPDSRSRSSSPAIMGDNQVAGRGTPATELAAVGRESPALRVPSGRDSPATRSGALGRESPVTRASAAAIASHEDDRDFRLWKKSVMLVYTRLCGHKFASLFMRPITDEQAPGYSLVIRRPMDFITIRKHIDTGIIRTTAEFQRDILLMLSNALMYNNSTHQVHAMAQEMHREAASELGFLLQAQAHAALEALTPAREVLPKRKRAFASSPAPQPNKKRRLDDA